MKGDRDLQPGDADFPAELANDVEPPSQLFVRGDLAALACRRVAIVGTRHATAYGRRIAYELGANLAASGVGIVSGLAIGIDAAAHEGALARNGRPIGVVASGLDNVYPRRHARLWEQVGRLGVLLTENPAQTAPLNWMFPRRNRMIAALAEIVVVVESAAKGGSMHTVESAMKRGIEVMAVPGPVGSPVSEGTNRLLVEGVAPVLGVEEVLTALDLCTAPRLFDAPKRPKISSLSVNARIVLAALDFAPMPTERLLAAVDLSPGAITVALQELAAANRANRGAGWWVRTP